MNKRLRLLSARVVLAVGLSLGGALIAAVPASAGTVTYAHTGNFRYMDDAVTTTINFNAGHPSHRVLIWSENPGAGYANNTVRMYNQQGTQVWSASGQQNRVYVVGSDVRRITVSRDCGCAGRNGVMAAS